MSSPEVPAPKEPGRPRGSDAILGLLFVIGLWILLSPLVPDILGWNFVCGKLGGESVLLRVFIGFLFLYFVGLSRDKNLLRASLAAIILEIRGFLSEGKRSRSGHPDLALFPPLIRALKSEQDETRRVAEAELRRMSGQSLGFDPKAWEEWLSKQRSSPTQ